MRFMWVGSRTTCLYRLTPVQYPGSSKYLLTRGITSHAVIVIYIGTVQFLFDRYVSKFLNNVFNPQPKVLTVPRKNIFMKLPYFGIKSNELKKELCQLLSKFYPQIKLNLILYNNCTIQSFFSF